MFERFKKKSIEISCPACKGGQTEPSLAFSTYCRNCGVHLKIMKGVARLNSGPQISGISTVKEVSPIVVEEQVAELKQQPASPARKARSKGKRKRNREKRQSKAEVAKKYQHDSEPVQESSVAAVFGLSTDQEPDHEPVGEPLGIGSESKPVDELNEGSMGAMISDLIEQERKRVQAMAGAPVVNEKKSAKSTSYQRNRHKVKVRCFRCHHNQWESRYAESTQCNRCNTYIKLNDIHIRQQSDQVIRTRGNVVIHRRGNFQGPELSCRDLMVMGSLSAKIDCSGEARFKHSVSVSGHLFCEELVIEKGVIVEFIDGVHTESAIINGTLRGDISCAGVVQVARTGILDGDVVAHGLDMTDGGTLTGELKLDTALELDLPNNMGYDPSIID